MKERSNPNIRLAIPFFWVANLERSIRFYTEGLGFVLKNEWIDAGKRQWCMLQRDEASLMLQEIRPERPHRNITTEEKGLGVSICFICDDALSFYHEVKTKGVDASRPFVGNGMWVTNVNDPDGYRLCFESLTDVPEETEYSEAIHG
jgi:catechol 2,3-dioxygenase-like lactoylglutathione lyase family enzyme